MAVATNLETDENEGSLVTASMVTPVPEVSTSVHASASQATIVSAATTSLLVAAALPYGLGHVTL